MPAVCFRNLGFFYRLLLVLGPLLSGSAVAAEPIILETLNPESIRLRGPDARSQLLVTSQSGAVPADHTRTAEYTVVPEHVAQIDNRGQIVPKSDGEAMLTAKLGDKLASIPIAVSRFADPPDIQFAGDIVPIFTKFGCNGGGCHGKSGGQNGFRLSLLGFHPQDDFDFVVHEDRGRRLFPAVPAESLLLLKATAKVPHGGGKRLDENSAEYRTLLRWIGQGMPRGDQNAPTVCRIECLPAARVMPRNAMQQIIVIAHYTDGRREDVTGSAVFESNDTELAESSATGLISTHDLAGEVAVMARFQGQAAVFRATVPLDGEPPQLPPANNLVDRAVFGKLRDLALAPSAACDDATFLRRATLDIAGRLPTAPESQQFLADGNADKRSVLVEQLLDSSDYADYFTNKWSFLLRNKSRQPEDAAGQYAFHRWIRDAIANNKPYDEFVREILTATGSPGINPATVWYREVDTVEEQVEDTSQLFLGLRIQCARCHHHPFEKWSQDDYYSLAAFFSQLKTKPLPQASAGSRDQVIYHESGRATAENPLTKRELLPRGLGGPALQVESDTDPRTLLADWLTDAQNPFFAKALVNRYWKHFLGRGLVEPEDDMRETNPPTNPELLHALTERFIASGYDMKDLIRTIVLSQTYQFSAVPGPKNERDRKNFSRFYPKRLPAEVLYDSLTQVTATPADLPGLPAGSRAMQLVDSSKAPYFLKVFGQPEADTACECERSQESNLAQSLHLLNSTAVQNRIGDPTGRAAVFASQTDRPHAERVCELYLWVYSRPPRDDELALAVDHVNSADTSTKTAYEDLIWALINTKEFLFNH